MHTSTVVLVAVALLLKLYWYQRFFSMVTCNE